MTTRPERRAYREAGVDVSAGESLVDAIRPIAESTRRAGCVDSVGGFGAAFDLAAAGFRDPVLVSATDGVGTKLAVAAETGRLESVGVDLVAMCVNDLVCHGAEPLFFLDYLAAGRLDPRQAERVIRGIAAGCRTGGLALIGGETAEMPGMYRPGEFDLAGFAVGATERGGLLPGVGSVGDRLIGILAEGPHANGYSLVRKIVADASLSWSDPAPFEDGTTLGEAFLRPTAIYVRPALALARSGTAKALAHVTGGGLTGNLARILAPDQAARIDPSSWPQPPAFDWLSRTGGIEREEMLAVFNCGIGMVAICDGDRADEALRSVREAGFEGREIGSVISRSDAPVEFAGRSPASVP